MQIGSCERVAVCAALAAVGQLCRAQGESIHLPNTSGQSVGIVRIPGTTALAPQRFTIEAWIRPDGPGFGNTHEGAGACIVGKNAEGIGGTYLPAWSLYWASSGTCTVHVVRTIGVGVSLYATTAVPTGTTAHVAATLDGTRVRMYINGVPAGEEEYPHPSVLANDDPVWIGAAEFCCGYFRRFHGMIDDVRIWDHARSQTEIADLMHCRLKGDEPGLLA